MTSHRILGLQPSLRVPRAGTWLTVHRPLQVLLAKTNWFFHAKSQLFHPKSIHSLRPTCHSTCPLPQRVLLSKGTSRLYESLPRVPAALILRQQAILRFQSASAALKSTIFMKFQHMSIPRVHPVKPCHGSNFFLSLWIELRFCMRQVMTSVAGGKILLAKTNGFFHVKSSTFQNFRPHSLHLSCHSTCPLQQRVLLSKRTSRLYESLLITWGMPFLRKQSDFAFLEVLNPSEIALFLEIVSSDRCHGCTHANRVSAWTFSISYGSS